MLCHHKRPCAWFSLYSIYLVVTVPVPMTSDRDEARWSPLPCSNINTRDLSTQCISIVCQRNFGWNARRITARAYASISTRTPATIPESSCEWRLGLFVRVRYWIEVLVLSHWGVHTRTSAWVRRLPKHAGSARFRLLRLGLEPYIYDSVPRSSSCGTTLYCPRSKITIPAQAICLCGRLFGGFWRP